MQTLNCNCLIKVQLFLQMKLDIFDMAGLLFPNLHSI